MSDERITPSDPGPALSSALEQYEIDLPRIYAHDPDHAHSGHDARGADDPAMRGL
ncbi:hypothetical protein ACTMTU_12820 [Streptomyces sp. OZ13]|uniref:hypothetical protein n=1 Tax=Streptomyces sp. OZ13 TaxID=3452210 RepID=UPI003F888A51